MSAAAALALALLLAAPEPARPAAARPDPARPAPGRVDPPGVYAPAADAAYAEAEAARRAGRFAEARAAFEALAAQHPTSRRAVQALVAAATIASLQQDAPEQAITLLEAALRGPADVPGAMSALVQRLGLERDLRGPEAEWRVIQTLVARRPQAEYVPYLVIRAARLARATPALGAARALDPIRGLTDDPRWQRTSWLDDALFERAQVERDAREPEAALRTLRRLVARRETSLVVGEYDSDWTDDAYLGIAELLAGPLARPADARAAYEALVDEVPASVFVDDALHRAAQLARAAGDTAGAARLEARLAALRPDSRFAKPNPPRTPAVRRSVPSSDAPREADESRPPPER
jgi:tetratricopeptide (TPR) repeat protein